MAILATLSQVVLFLGFLWKYVGNCCDARVSWYRSPALRAWAQVDHVSCVIISSFDIAVSYISLKTCSRQLILGEFMMS